MPGRRDKNCSTIYRSPSHQAYAGEKGEDDKCCRPWCFVEARCPVAKPSRLLPGRFVSYASCGIRTVEEEENYHACAWRDSLARFNLHTFARDHSTPEGYTPEGAVRKAGPRAPPIAEVASVSVSL